MKDAVQYGLGFVSARPVVGEQSTRCGRRRKAMCTVMRDRTAFTSSRRFSGKVQGTALELREFMRTDPGGLVKACWSEKFVQKLDENLYRTSMPPMQFLQFNLKAFADVRATYDEDIQGIRLKSVGSRVDVPQMGIDAESFQLELSGVLLGRDNSQNAMIDGKADLEVSLVLPSIARLIPKAMIETAGSQITSTVLDMMKRNLTLNYPRAHLRWLRYQQSTARTHRKGSLETDP
mmetsp:Transcript_7367/g.22455  ORF Transcript_7367/g.22455 Transcript_7367/m.22455 type:complete len:234 (+) Transcript_7367:116-817(+)